MKRAIMIDDLLKNTKFDVSNWTEKRFEKFQLECFNLGINWAGYGKILRPKVYNHFIVINEFLVMSWTCLGGFNHFSKLTEWPDPRYVRLDDYLSEPHLIKNIMNGDVSDIGPKNAESSLYWVHFKNGLSVQYLPCGRLSNDQLHSNFVLINPNQSSTNQLSKPECKCKNLYHGHHKGCYYFKDHSEGFWK